jgi:hypothetical protein
MKKHSNRGQALVEMAIVLPLVLFSLYMLFWTARYAIVNERLYRDVRYANEIGNATNTFTYVSFPELYNSGIASQKWPIGCASPAPNFLANGTLGLAQIKKSSLKSYCNEYRFGTADANLSRQLIFNFNLPLMSAQFTAPLDIHPGFTFGALPLSPSGTGYFSFPDLADITLCFPDMATAIQQSLIQGAMAAQDGTLPIVSKASDLHQPPPVAPMALASPCVGPPTIAGQPPTGFDAPTPPPPPPPGQLNCYLSPCGVGSGTRGPPAPPYVVPPNNGPPGNDSG